MNIKNEILKLASQVDKQPIFPNPNFPPSLYYRFFELLSRNFKFKVAVELGVCGGGGSLHLAKGNPEGKVIGVDVAWDYADNIYYITDHYSNFGFWNMDSIEAAKKIFKLYGSIDFLFIDTIHTYDRTMLEFNTYKPYLSKDAIVCLDDLFRPGMEKAYDDMPGEKMRLDFLHPGYKIDETRGDGGFSCHWRVK